MNLKNNNSHITNHNFFTIHATKLAQKLLGKILVQKINDQVIKVKIVETEAYMGLSDKACHSHWENRSRKKATAMYNQGGCAYIYLIYSMYYCFNIVSAKVEDPQAVLIRAAEPLDHHTIPAVSQHNQKKKISLLH